MASFTEKIRLLFEVDDKGSFGRLKGDLDDSRTAGQRFADAMSQVADDLRSDLRQAESATDSLATALGDEFVAEVKAAGGSVDAMVDDLHRAGLTYDEIKADADALATSIKDLADAGKRAGDDVDSGAAKAKGGLDDVRASGDQTGSRPRQHGRQLGSGSRRDGRCRWHGRDGARPARRVRHRRQRVAVQPRQVRRSQEAFTNALIDSARETGNAEQATRDLEAAYDKLMGTLDDDEAWLNLQDDLRQYREDMHDASLSNDEKRLSIVKTKQALVEVSEQIR